MVAEFHAHPNSAGDKHARALAPTLIEEEAEELRVELVAGWRRSMSSLEPDREKIARECADVAYVAFYAAHVYGIDLDAALREVHRAAMDKMGANKRRLSDGKIVKPPGFVPPDMTEAVAPC